MPESKEQIEARKARSKEKRKGARADGVNAPKSKASGAVETPAKTKRKRGAGKAPKSSRKTEGQRSTEEWVDDMTPEPEAVSVVPDSPWGIYSHFGKVVRKKFPDAQLSKHNGKYLKWGKLLLQKFSTSQIYEMIEVLVLDYENLSSAKIFFKYSGTPTPTYDQLFSNADTLVTYIGSGIICPPAARYSAYAEDYNKRHSKVTDDSGKTTDPVQALRDQYKQDG